MSDVDGTHATSIPILLAEDDPVSAQFMGEALQNMGLDVQLCMNGEHTLRRAREQHFDLLLLDCRLPGLGARQILEALRADPAAASRDTPVLATSADVTPVLERELYTSGCQGVLAKPLQVPELELAVQACLENSSVTLLDDEGALNASGNIRNLRALRGLFIDELQAVTQQFPDLLEDPRALGERLHRLRASCGFCGAALLAARCRQLEAALANTQSTRKQVIRAFHETLQATLRALRNKAQSQT